MPPQRPTYGAWQVPVRTSGDETASLPASTGLREHHVLSPPSLAETAFSQASLRETKQEGFLKLWLGWWDCASGEF